MKYIGFLYLHLQETELLDSKDILSRDSKDICLKIQKQSLIIKGKILWNNSYFWYRVSDFSKANFVLKSFTFNFLVLSKDCPFGRAFVFLKVRCAFEVIKQEQSLFRK